MRKTEKLIKRLNHQVVCATFIEYKGWRGSNDSADAVYFGVNIDIGFPCSAAEIRRDEEALDHFQIHLCDEGFVKKENSPSLFFDAKVDTLEEAALIINHYIRSRPFTLVKKAPDQYDLLDPNGNMFRSDLTLKQARSLSDDNLKLASDPSC